MTKAFKNLAFYPIYFHIPFLDQSLRGPVLTTIRLSLSFSLFLAPASLHKHTNMCTKSTKLKAFLFPWLVYGQISLFLELAKKLMDGGFLMDLCSSPINLSFIRTRIPESCCSSIHLVELQLPDLPELPCHYHTTNGLPLHPHSTLQKSPQNG